MLASWKTAKVIGLDPIPMGFQEIVTAVMCHADARLMAVPVANHKSFGVGIDRRNSHGFGVVLLRIGCAVNASHYWDAPVRGMPNTIQIDHFDFSVFCLTDDIC